VGEDGSLLYLGIRQANREKETSIKEARRWDEFENVEGARRETDSLEAVLGKKHDSREENLGSGRGGSEQAQY